MLPIILNFPCWRERSCPSVSHEEVQFWEFRKNNFIKIAVCGMIFTKIFRLWSGYKKQEDGWLQYLSDPSITKIGRLQSHRIQEFIRLFTIGASCAAVNELQSRLYVIRSSKRDKNLIRITGSSNNWKVRFPIILSIIINETQPIRNRNNSYQILWD